MKPGQTDLQISPEIAERLAHAEGEPFSPEESDDLRRHLEEAAQTNFVEFNAALVEASHVVEVDDTMLKSTVHNAS